MNPAGGDYHLQERRRRRSTPARASLAPPADFDGLPRPAGGRVRHRRVRIRRPGRRLQPRRHRERRRLRRLAQHARLDRHAIQRRRRRRQRHDRPGRLRRAGGPASVRRPPAPAARSTRPPCPNQRPLHAAVLARSLLHASARLMSGRFQLGRKLQPLFFQRRQLRGQLGKLGVQPLGFGRVGHGQQLFADAPASPRPAGRSSVRPP